MDSHRGGRYLGIDQLQKKGQLCFRRLNPGAVGGEERLTGDCKRKSGNQAEEEETFSPRVGEQEGGALSPWEAISFAEKVLAWQLELYCCTDHGGLELITCELQGPQLQPRARPPVNIAGSPSLLGLSTNPTRFPSLIPEMVL